MWFFKKKEKKAATGAGESQKPVKKKESRRKILKKAYNRGYKSGWKDREAMPDVKGTGMVAKLGYRHGSKDRGRYEKSREKK